MLVAALRSDNPLGGAPLACDAAAEHFTIHGIGEITAAKLLDLENRRQLVWADPVTREWVLETVALRVRRATAAKAAARAAAAAAAASAAAASAREQARAGDIARAGAGTLVFEPPPPAGARHPAGVRAARTRFETPVAVGDGPRRVVWSESSTAATLPPRATAPSIATPATTTPGPPPATRRVDRRRSLKVAERHRALVSMRLAGAPAAVVLLVLAVLAVVALLVAAHGGF
jgi:hypothetical protein